MGKGSKDRVKDKKKVLTKTLIGFLVNAVPLKGRNPNKSEKQHMDKVVQLGCIVCRNKGF